MWQLVDNISSRLSDIDVVTVATQDVVETLHDHFKNIRLAQSPRRYSICSAVMFVLLYLNDVMPAFPWGQVHSVTGRSFSVALLGVFWVFYLVFRDYKPRSPVCILYECKDHSKNLVVLVTDW